MVSCLRFLMNSKNHTSSIIITQEAGLTPHEASISYDVYGRLMFLLYSDSFIAIVVALTYCLSRKFCYSSCNKFWILHTRCHDIWFYSNFV